MAEETKHDILLKRVQVTLAILTGVVGLIVALYNLNKIAANSGNGEISLTVQTENHASLDGVSVELFNSQNALVNATRTDRRGHYGRKKLPAGGYMLKITHDGYEPQAVTAQVNAKESTDLEVVLRSLTQGQPGSPIRSALEEAGASWIKNLSKNGSSSDQK